MKTKNSAVWLCLIMSVGASCREPSQQISGAFIHGGFAVDSVTVNGQPIDFVSVSKYTIRIPIQTDSVLLRLVSRGHGSNVDLLLLPPVSLFSNYSLERFRAERGSGPDLVEPLRYRTFSIDNSSGHVQLDPGVRLRAYFERKDDRFSEYRFELLLSVSYAMGSEQSLLVRIAATRRGDARRSFRDELRGLTIREQLREEILGYIKHP